MNLELAKTLAWYGGIISAIIGFIWITWQMTRKEVDSSSKQGNDFKKIPGIAWGITLIPVAIILILTSIAPQKEGIRGILTSLLAGIIIPVLLFSLENHFAAKAQTSKQFFLPAFLAVPLTGMGLNLLFMGFTVFLYGIRADNLWISFIIGMGLSLFVLKISSAMSPEPKHETTSATMESIFFIMLAFMISIIMAGYHFPTTTVSAYLPLFILMALFISLLVSSLLVRLKPKKKTMDILPTHLAVFQGLFIGLCLMLVMRMNIDISYLYPVITGSIISILFIVMLYDSSSIIKQVDLSTGVMSVLLLLGGLWLSFKWTMGFGITLFGTGLISIAAVLIPYKYFEVFTMANDCRHHESDADFTQDPLMQGIEKPMKKTDLAPGENRGEIEKSSGFPGDHSWACLFLRGITLAGLAVIIIGLYRVLVQNSFLIQTGLDIAVGDNAAALFLGIFTPLSFEGFNLMGRNIFLPRQEGNFKTALSLLIFSIITALILVYTIGIIFKLEGLAIFILGIAVSALLGTYTYFAQKKEIGIYRASFSPLWIAIAAYSTTLVEYAEVPDQLTRLAKQQIVTGMLLFVIVVYFWAHYRNRMALQKEDTITAELKTEG
jgi:hypothetical protein